MKKIYLLAFLMMSLSFLYSQDTWMKQNSNTSEKLRSIHFVTNHVGFAVGTNSTFLKTTDGGTTWINGNILGYKDLYYVRFLSSTLGYVTTGDSIGKAHILKTTDGGNTWNSIKNMDSAIFTKIKFYTNYAGEANKLIVVSCKTNNSTKFLVSTNGGTAWGPKTSASTEVKGFDFTKSTFPYGYTCGTAGTIYQYPNFPNGEVGTNFSINFEDLNELFVYGVNKAYAVGNKGTIINSGADQWVDVSNGLKENFYDLSFLNANIGWVAGGDSIYKAVIYKTTNSGMSWVKQFSDSTIENINSIFFYSKDLGYVCGANGLIVKYTSSPEFTITTGALPTTKFCKGDNQFSISFLTEGTYNDDNTYKLELSDKNGSFANPLVLKQITSKQNNGKFDAILPETLEISDAQTYKLRITSTSPAIIGAESPDKIGIYSYPSPITFSGGGTFCENDTNAFILMENVQKGFSYYFIVDGNPSGPVLKFYGVTDFKAPINKSGIYKILIKNSGHEDCSILLNDSVSFIINPLPQTPYLTFDNKAKTLTSSSPNGNQWYFEGSKMLDSINQMIYPQKEGKYSVIVTLDNCSSQSSQSYLYKISALDENIVNTNISPNPAQDYIIIKDFTQDWLSTNSPADKMGSSGVFVEILNIFGESIDYSFLSIQNYNTAASNGLKINVSNLPSGIYFIRIGNRLEKFLKL